MVYTLGEKEYDFFERNSLVASLEACESAGYSALFLPEFADLKIAHPRLFRGWGRSMSIRATGRTSAGSAVEVYAHVPGEWVEKKYLSEGRFINGTLVLSDGAIDALVERDGEASHGTRLVTVMDHTEANRALFGEQTLDQARENPHVLASFGSKDRTERYLAQHKDVFGERIYVLHSNDLGNQAVVRPLVLNGSVLDSDNNFVNIRRVAGVRPLQERI